MATPLLRAAAGRGAGPPCKPPAAASRARLPGEFAPCLSCRCGVALADRDTRAMLRAIATLGSLALFSLVAPPQQSGPYEPFIEPASAEAAAHLEQIRLAPGLAATLWAAEPRLANPVCLALDERGRVFVAESFRIHKGVYDVRDTMDWLDDDLSCQTVADRVEMYRKHLGADFPSASRERDRIRELRDTDGDGVADRDSVFADDFG